MQQIKIENNYFLKDQEIELNSSLNIITSINGGVLRFTNNSGNKIAFNEISNSEKTAFILWLATKCESDILILDNVDSVFCDCNIFYKLLSQVSDKKQIISTSNRNIFGFEDCVFDIQDGIIAKQVGLKN